MAYAGYLNATAYKHTIYLARIHYCVRSYSKSRHTRSNRCISQLQSGTTSELLSGKLQYKCAWEYHPINIKGEIFKSFRRNPGPYISGSLTLGYISYLNLNVMDSNSLD